MSKKLSASCINRYCELIGKCVLKKTLNRVLMNAGVKMMKANTEPGIYFLKNFLFVELHVEDKAE